MEYDMAKEYPQILGAYSQEIQGDGTRGQVTYAQNILIPRIPRPGYQEGGQ